MIHPDEEKNLIEWAWNLFDDMRAGGVHGLSEDEMENWLESSDKWNEAFQRWAGRHDQ